MSKDLACDEQRKRGGQPGNLNALKHGRYPRVVPPDDSKELPNILSSSLDEEIRMLRKATRRVFELAQQAEDIDLAIKSLGSLGLAMIRTSRLLKSQKEWGWGPGAGSHLGSNQRCAGRMGLAMSRTGSKMVIDSKQPAIQDLQQL